MNTPTIVAAALLGYTWGYHPLDERSTEFLVQLSPSDMEVMAGGQSEILVNVPPEARPVGGVRIIVGNEQLPRRALPPSEMGDERTAARPTQPAIAYGPQEPPLVNGPSSEAKTSDLPDLSFGSDNRYGGSILPPSMPPMGSRPEIDRRPMGVPADDVVPSPYGSPPLGESRDGLERNPHDPIGGSRPMVEVDTVVDAPPATSLEAYRPDSRPGLPLDDDDVRNSVVTNVGPTVTPGGDATPFAWDGTANPSDRPSDSEDGPPKKRAASTPGDSPSESGSPAVESRQRVENDSANHWRSWTLVTGPVAFGLFWLNLYQWGTYKSIRQRYLSLLRRTGEV